MKTLLLFLLFPIFVCSCVTPYYVSTNTYADMRVIPQGFQYGSSFAIVPVDNSLFSKEVAYKVRRFLEQSGFYVCDEETAQYVLSFSYDMDCSTQTVSVPVYVPGPTHIREGSIIGSDGLTHFQETTTELGSTVYVPEEVVVYHRQLSIHVYDVSCYRSDKKDEIWQGSSISTGSNGDFRDTIDYLLVSAFRFFGLNTKKNIQMTLDEKDPVVQWLRH